MLVFGGQDLVRDDGGAIVQLRFGRGVAGVVAKGGGFVVAEGEAEAEGGAGEGEEEGEDEDGGW